MTLVGWTRVQWEFSDARRYVARGFEDGMRILLRVGKEKVGV